MLSCYGGLAAVALCAGLVVAQPQVAYPFNAQLPPVAIANEHFSFTFSTDTFISTLPLQYTLIQAPSWLQFHGPSRTLSGTPSLEDVGNGNLQIQATDDYGPTLLDMALIVLRQNTIRIKENTFAERISQAGNYSAPNTVLLHPENVFHLNFSSEIFQGLDKNTHFYATSGNNTPLPAWIRFDAGTVSFIGTTPSLLTPQSSPQTFAFALSASQIAGFTQSTVSFVIAVANHVLAFDEPMLKLNMTAGESVLIPPLLNQLHREGAPIGEAQITKLSSNQPEWLSIDTDRIAFSGTAPKDVTDTVFHVTVMDEQNNSASIGIQLDVEQPTYVYLGTVEVQPGESLAYTFTKLNVSGLTDEVEISLGSTTSWLTFIELNATVKGLVPVDAAAEANNITLTIKEGFHTVEVQYLTINIEAAMPSVTEAAGSTSTATDSPSETAVGTDPHDAAQNGGPWFENKLLLTSTIMLPILAVLAVSLALFIRRKRFGRSSPTQTLAPSSMRYSSTSRSSSNIVVLATSSTEGSLTPEVSPAPAPRIEIPWTFRKRLRNEVFHTVVRTEPIDSPETRDSWDDMLMNVEESIGISQNQTFEQLSSAPNVAAVTSKQTSGSKEVVFRSVLASETSCDLGSPQARTPLLQSMSPDAGLSTSRFNGRRSSGAGHGTSVRGLEPQKLTLRQVPLSPLMESPSATRTIDMTQSSYSSSPIKIIQASSSRYHSDSDEGSSLASGGSKYELGPQPGSRSESITSDTIYDRTSGEGDWLTEASGLRSRHGPYDPDQFANGPASRNEIMRHWREGPSQSSTALPSNAASLRSQPSEQSYSNSIRFI